MWRTIYLSKLPGLDKKVRVAFDWTLDLLFPKDVCAVHDLPARRNFPRSDQFKDRVAKNGEYQRSDGQTKSVAENDSATGRAQNRRVELAEQ
jgi:hypothetical protein